MRAGFSGRGRRPRSRTTPPSRKSISEAAMAEPILRISGLHVFYGESHAIQGVELAVADPVLSIVGRNGMGKTTLCNTIAGLLPARSGSIVFAGEEIAGLDAHVIARRGVGYVPQGRRVWPTLTVDEHLRVAA